MAFDPDAYLAGGSFDPDAYLGAAKPPPQAAQPNLANAGMYEGAGGLRAGFMRGVEQTLGGVGQRALELNKKIADNKVQTILDKVKAGELPMNQETVAELDYWQGEAVKMAQGLKMAGASEQSSRDQYAPIAEERPIASTVGNIAGQMASLPIPGVGQAKGLLGLGKQMLGGAAGGALVGASQATVDDESAQENALLGGGMGAAVPLALKPLVSGAGGAYRALTGKASGQGADAARYADENNLPIMTTDVVPPETFAGKSAQELGEKLPVVGTGAARAEQQKARVKLIQEAQAEYGIPNDEEIVKSLKSKSSRLSQAAGKRYEETINAMADTPIPLTTTIKAIDDQIAKYTRPGAAGSPALVKGLQDFKEQITSGDNDLRLLRQNRTVFRELIKGPDTVMSDSAKQANDAVYRAITADMTRGVSEKLGPDAARAMRQVDGIWAREASELKNTKLKNIFAKGEIKPEEATKMLFASDPSEVSTLFTALDQTGRKNARAAIMSRAIERSKESPERFITEIEKMRPQIKTFFRGEDRKAMDGMINYLRHTQGASKAAVSTKTGQNVFQIAAPAGVMADVATTGGMGTLGFASIGAAANVYESKPVRNIMMKMASVKKGSTEFEKLAAELEALLQQAAPRAPFTQE